MPACEKEEKSNFKEIKKLCLIEENRLDIDKN